MAEQFPIRLRRTEREDLPTLWQWNLNDELAHLEAFTNLKSLAQFKDWFEKRFNDPDIYDFVIELVENGKVIGFCGIKDINWTFRNGEVFISICEKEYWKNGYATLAGILLINIIFNQLNLHRVFAKASDINKPSMQFLERGGFKHEGTLREAYYSKGKYHDIHIYGALQHEFQELIPMALERMKDYMENLKKQEEKESTAKNFGSEKV